jgi:hypothetical protein
MPVRLRENRTDVTRKPTDHRLPAHSTKSTRETQRITENKRPQGCPGYTQRTPGYT